MLAVHRVPEPPALQVVIPELRLVKAKSPFVPPLPIVVVPDRTGRAAIPDDGVTVDGVVSPTNIDSTFSNAEPALVTVVSV